MRIDITPAMLEQLQQAPEPGGVRLVKRVPGGLNVPQRPGSTGVIRIPAAATLHELADEFGVSAERIRQIEVKALQKMKGVLGDLR